MILHLIKIQLKKTIDKLLSIEGKVVSRDDILKTFRDNTLRFYMKNGIVEEVGKFRYRLTTDSAEKLRQKKACFKKITTLRNKRVEFVKNINNKIKDLQREATEL